MGDTGMNRFAFGFAAVAGVALLSTSVLAADYAVSPRVRSEVVEREDNPYCGPRCGCPVVTFVRHHELQMAYPSEFDPRDFRNHQEPHFYYGRVRTFARFQNNVVARNCS